MPRFKIAPKKSRWVRLSANLRSRGEILIQSIGYGSSNPKSSGLPKRTICRSQEALPPKASEWIKDSSGSVR